MPFAPLDRYRIMIKPYYTLANGLACFAASVHANIINMNTAKKSFRIFLLLLAETGLPGVSRTCRAKALELGLWCL